MKTVFVSLMILSSLAFAEHDHTMPTPKVSPTFEKLKGLVGTWEGTTKMNGKEEPTKVIYELTSGGTAIIEKIMPGTPHEMTTIYSSRGNDVNATHYCLVGNQPEMKLKKTEGDTFQFEMDGTKGISNKKEAHMHSLALTMTGNKLKQEWTNYKDNKKEDTAVFEFTKKN